MDGYGLTGRVGFTIGQPGCFARFSGVPPSSRCCSRRSFERRPALESRRRRPYPSSRTAGARACSKTCTVFLGGQQFNGTCNILCQCVFDGPNTPTPSPSPEPSATLTRQPVPTETATEPPPTPTRVGRGPRAGRDRHPHSATTDGNSHGNGDDDSFVHPSHHRRRIQRSRPVSVTAMAALRSRWTSSSGG